MDNRNTNVSHDTEDKAWWLQHGENLEVEFVARCRQRLKLEIALNPEKQRDKTVPDLVFGERLADLKTQNTPFFMASRYGIDPQFCVTFNRKDFERYSDRYPDIVIFFWVDWKQVTYKSVSVQPMTGIFMIEFSDIRKQVNSGAPEHSYLRRAHDRLGNAKSSFLFDVRTMHSLAIQRT